MWVGDKNLIVVYGEKETGLKQFFPKQHSGHQALSPTYQVPSAYPPCLEQEKQNRNLCCSKHLLLSIATR